MYRLRCLVKRLKLVFSTDRSKAVLLLEFFFVRASMFSYVMLVSSSYVPHRSFFGALGRICFVTVVFSGYLNLYLRLDRINK